MDGVGSAYVTGETSSADFPTASFQNDLASAPDAFVTKLVSLTNHFLCYRVRRGKGSPKFVKRQIILEDLIDIEEFVLKKPKSLCNPATKGSEGVDDPSTHLVSHKVKGPRRHLKRRDIKVVNQFGTIFVDTKRPTRLFVPSVKDLTSPVDLPEPFTHNVNHFKCYKTKARKKVCEKNRRVRCISDADCTAAGLTGACNLGFTKGIIVDVVDQFSDKRFDVLKPERLCIPADKDNEAIKEVAGPDSLMCYRVKRAKNQPKHEKVIDIHVNNQFGPERLSTRRIRELCVPSLITLE